nr:hypothetical protein GCM10020063_023720 [Dactylosporangium thailandense]
MPRTRLRERYDEGDGHGPRERDAGGGRRIGELMCVIEDSTPADRERLADFLEGRGDAQLAAWVRIAFDQRPGGHRVPSTR